MTVHWAKQALDDSKQIWDYLVAKIPDAAIKMDELFETTADVLADFPYRGMPVKSVELVKFSPIKTTAWFTKSSQMRFGCWLWCIPLCFGPKYFHSLKYLKELR